MNIRETIFCKALAGERAHNKMAPSPRYIKDMEGEHSSPPIGSAVLVLIIPHENELVVPFIKRSNHGKYHGGQIAFPGGKIEKDDIDASYTALRECYEEIGVPQEQISILGVLSEVYITISNFNITPIVGSIASMPNFTLSTNEVEEVILVKLSDLFDDKNKSTRTLSRREQEISAPGYVIGEHFIWGATAMIIAELEELMSEMSLFSYPKISL